MRICSENKILYEHLKRGQIYLIITPFCLPLLQTKSPARSYMQIRMMFLLSFWLLCSSKSCHPCGHFYHLYCCQFCCNKNISVTSNAKMLQNYYLFVLVYEFLARVYLHDDGVISQSQYIGQNVNHRNLENVTLYFKILDAHRSEFTLFTFSQKNI